MGERTARTPKKDRARLLAERAAKVAAERAQKQARFLTAFRDSANVRAACLAAGIGRRTVYEWRDEYPAFAAQWAEAEADAVDVLEVHAWKRATQGVTREHALLYQGQLVGKDIVTEYSDTLLIFLLKAHRPEKYRDTVNLRVLIERETAALAERLGVNAPDILQEFNALLGATT